LACDKQAVKLTIYVVRYTETVKLLASPILTVHSNYMY